MIWLFLAINVHNSNNQTNISSKTLHKRTKRVQLPKGFPEVYFYCDIKAHRVVLALGHSCTLTCLKRLKGKSLKRVKATLIGTLLVIARNSVEFSLCSTLCTEQELLSSFFLKSVSNWNEAPNLLEIKSVIPKEKIFDYFRRITPQM